MTRGAETHGHRASHRRGEQHGSGDDRQRRRPGATRGGELRLGRIREEQRGGVGHVPAVEPVGTPSQATIAIGKLQRLYRAVALDRRTPMLYLATAHDTPVRITQVRNSSNSLQLNVLL